MKAGNDFTADIQYETKAGNAFAADVQSEPKAEYAYKKLTDTQIEQ